MAYDLRSRVTFQLGTTGTGRLHWRFASSDCRPPGDRAPGVLVPQNGRFRDHPSTTRWPGAQRLGNLLCAVGGPMTFPSGMSCQAGGVQQPLRPAPPLRSPDDASEACDSYEADPENSRTVNFSSLPSLFIINLRQKTEEDPLQEVTD